MEINVLDAQKLVEVWMTNAEKNDAQLQAELKPLYQMYQRQQYTVAVFQSGKGDLYAHTRDLITHHRRRQREQEQKVALLKQ